MARGPGGAMGAVSSFVIYSPVLRARRGACGSRRERGRTYFLYLSRLSASTVCWLFPFLQNRPRSGARGVGGARFPGLARLRFASRARPGLRVGRPHSGASGLGAAPFRARPGPFPPRPWRRAKLVSFWVAQKLTRTECLLRDPLREHSCEFVAILIRVPLGLGSSFASIRVIRGQSEDLTAETQRAQRGEGGPISSIQHGMTNEHRGGCKLQATSCKLRAGSEEARLGRSLALPRAAPRSPSPQTHTGEHGLVDH